MNKNERYKRDKEVRAAIAELDLKVGDTFSTVTPDGSVIEENCVVLSVPDEYGHFEAYDSEMVICLFEVRMVKK